MSVMASIAKAANVSEAWLLTGQDEEATRPPRYHSLADLPYLVSAEAAMDEHARARAVEKQMAIEPELESLREELRRLRAEFDRLNGEVEHLKSISKPQSRTKSRKRIRS